MVIKTWAFMDFWYFIKVLSHQTGNILIVHFWNMPGYLGYNPPASLLKARIQQVSRIKTGISIDEAVNLGLAKPISPTERGTADAAWKAIGGVEGSMPVAFQLQDKLPDINFMGGDLIIKSGAAAGKVLQLTKIADDKVVLGPADAAVLAQVKQGDTVQVDNSNFLGCTNLSSSSGTREGILCVGSVS